MPRATNLKKSTPSANVPTEPLPTNNEENDLDDESDDGEEEDIDLDGEEDYYEEPATTISVKPIKKSTTKTSKNNEESDEEDGENDDEPIESDEESVENSEDEGEDEEDDDAYEDDEGDNENIDESKPKRKITKVAKPKPVKKIIKDDDDAGNGDEDDEDGVGDVDVDLDIDDLFEIDAEPIKVGSSKRICKPFVTKYERVNLLSTRARQLLGGAKPMIKNTAGLNHIEIAKLEFQHKTIPLKIIRDIPNSEPEIWLLSELEFNN